MKHKLIPAIVFSAAMFSMPVVQAQATDPSGAQLYADATVSCQLPVQLLDTRQESKNLYTPFAVNTLTPEQQAAYLALIQKIWPWVYDDMEEWEISDEMADIVNIVLEEIAHCSRAMAEIQQAEFLYEQILGFRIARILGHSGPTIPWPDFASDNIVHIFNMMEVVEGSWRYRSCVYTAAWVWKSAMEMAYQGY